MLGLLLISLSVGLSNFSTSIALGFSGVSWRIRKEIALIFGFFEGIMPVIGFFLGNFIATKIENYGKYLGASLLIAIGIYVLWKAIKSSKKIKMKKNLSLQHLIPLGFILSLDNLIIGFALGFYKIPIFLAAATIASISVVMSLLGIEIGSRFSKLVGVWGERLQGIILILTGILIFTGYLQ